MPVWLTAGKAVEKYDLFGAGRIDAKDAGKNRCAFRREGGLGVAKGAGGAPV